MTACENMIVRKDCLEWVDGAGPLNVTYRYYPVFVPHWKLQMRYLLLVPIVYAAAVLQTSLAGVLSVGRVGPDWMALVAVIWLLTVAGPRVFVAAGAIGLVADLIAPGRVGIGMACFLLVGYALARLRTRLPAADLAGRVAIVLVAVTLTSLGIGFAGWLLGDPSPGLREVFARSVGVGIYTAGVSIPWLMILGWSSEPGRARQRQFSGR